MKMKNYQYCPICHSELELPIVYLNAIECLRLKIGEFSKVAIQDFILNDLKDPLFELIKSHSKLAQAEYNRDPGYNDKHFSHKAEIQIIAFLEEFGLMEDFLKNNA